MTPKGRALISAVAFAAALPLAAWTGTQSPAPGKGLDFPTAVFDFGHIGIDYTVRFRYPVINRSPDTVRVRKVDVHCDCSAAFVADSVLAPGDSTNIHLRFNTRDFYGPQNKSLTITTDREGQSTIDLYYLSIIGQWFNGIKPD
ncbi:MAG TPA: DUF1573 domain-containing protein, partial [candidate division Zixibacteria bacterium]|nr:DUF1573 domain-containing protein [candidate division Zixibacteria bacterium]